jgi:hypothetical protein
MTLTVLSFSTTGLPMDCLIRFEGIAEYLLHGGTGEEGLFSQ